MGYTPIQAVQQGRTNKSTVSTGAIKGVNLLTAPEFLDTSWAQVMNNYLIEQDGDLVKRLGSTELFNVAGNNPVTMLVEFTPDLFMFGFSTTVAVYRLSTDTVTTIKSDFVTSDPFSGVTYGNYFFVTNGGNKIGRITQTLDFDAQTTNFTVGEVITGGTSATTAVILEQVDGGGTGTLTLGNINGTFENNEPITDPLGGDGDVDGVLNFVFVEITQAPKAKIIAAFDARLFAGNVEGNTSKVQWAAQDDGSNPPFDTWTPSGSPPTAESASSLEFRNAGDFKAFASLGSQVVALFDSGKTGFRLDTIDVSGSGLSQVTIVDFQRIDFGGERGALTTPVGVFYVNESGVWQMVSGGSTNQPFSEQENNISRVFGEDFIDGIDFTDSDIVFDTKRNLVLIPCKRGSSFNNLVLWYNINSKNFGTFTGLNIARFLKTSGTIFFGSSLETKVFRLFDTSSDDGIDIPTELKQEINLGDLDGLHQLVNTSIKGFISDGGNITVSFDIYNKDGILTTDFKTFTLTAGGSIVNAEGFNEFSFGDGFGGGPDNLNLLETRGKKRTRIRQFTRIIMKITSSDSFPHKLTWISLDTRFKGENRRKNNLT